MVSCSICLNNRSNFTTNCNHKFCNGCITNWLLTHNNCPMCRKEFYDISEEINNYENELVNAPYLDSSSLYRDFMNIYNRQYFYLFPDGIYIYWILTGKWYYDYIEDKLPKNINMHYRKRNYRFDNTNFNHIDTRY